MFQTKYFIWGQKERERQTDRERERVTLGRLRKEKQSERLSTEARGNSLEKIAPSSLLYYITLVDKKNPTSSKVITAQ